MTIGRTFGLPLFLVAFCAAAWAVDDPSWAVDCPSDQRTDPPDCLNGRGTEGAKKFNLVNNCPHQMFVVVERENAWNPNAELSGFYGDMPPGVTFSGKAGTFHLFKKTRCCCEISEACDGGPSVGPEPGAVDRSGCE